MKQTPSFCLFRIRGPFLPGRFSNYIGALLVSDAESHSETLLLGKIAATILHLILPGFGFFHWGVNCLSVSAWMRWSVRVRSQSEWFWRAKETASRTGISYSPKACCFPPPNGLKHCDQFAGCVLWKRLN